MKKTQDQRFLEYAGIITSGKLQERGKRKTHIYGVLKAFRRHTKVEVLLACRVCECGELSQTSSAADLTLLWSAAQTDWRGCSPECWSTAVRQRHWSLKQSNHNRLKTDTKTTPTPKNLTLNIPGLTCLERRGRNLERHNSIVKHEWRKIHLPLKTRTAFQNKWLQITTWNIQKNNTSSHLR